MSLFEKPENLSAYLTHPDHQQGVRKWKKVANWKVVDIDLGSGTTRFFGLLNALVGASEELVQN